MGAGHRGWAADVIEAAYCSAADDEVWLTGLIDAARPDPGSTSPYASVDEMTMETPQYRRRNLLLMSRRSLVAVAAAVSLLLGDVRDARADNAVPCMEDWCGLAVVVLSTPAALVSLVVNVRDLIGVANHRQPGPGWLVAGYLLGTVAAVVGLAWAIDGFGASDPGAPAALLSTYGFATVGATIWATAMPAWMDYSRGW